MTKSDKQKEILHCLLLGERRFADFKELGYNDVTLTRHLKALESDNYISHNHLKKVYKITSKGVSFLNQLDNESRGKVFAAEVFSAINHNLRFWYVFDARIPDDVFVELAKQLSKINKYTYTPDADMKILDEMCEVFANKYNDLNLEKIPSTDVVLREGFFEVLSFLITEAVLYVCIKSIEEKDEEVLNLLNSLPRFIISRIKLHSIPVKQIKDHLKMWSLFNAFYESSKKITPEAYKQIVDMYEKNNDYLLLDAIGGDFSKKITSQTSGQIGYIYEESAEYLLSEAIGGESRVREDEKSVDFEGKKRKDMAEKK